MGFLGSVFSVGLKIENTVWRLDGLTRGHLSLESVINESFSFLRSPSARPTISDTGDLGDLEHSEVFGLLPRSDFGDLGDLAGLGRL